MAKWYCIECETIFIAKDYPIINWTDGHKCIFKKMDDGDDDEQKRKD